MQSKYWNEPQIPDALIKLNQTLESLKITAEDRAIIETFKQELLQLDANSQRASLLVTIFWNNSYLAINGHGTRKSFLMDAAEAGDCGLIKLLKALGTDLNKKLNDGRSALTLALCANKQEAANLLEDLMEEARGLSANELALTALLKKPTLSQDEELSLLKLLSEGVNPNLLAGSGVPALVFALQKGNLQAAKILCTQENIDKNCLGLKHPPFNESLFNSLSKKTAPLSNLDKDLIKFLCHQGVDPNVDMLDGLTVMDCARVTRKIEFIRLINQFSSEEKQENDENKVNEDLKINTAIKQAGHILGIKAKIYDFNTEGYADIHTYLLLKKYLSQTSPSSETQPLLIKKYYSSANSPLKEALDLSSEWLKIDGVITHKDLLKHYHRGKPLFIPSGWERHSFTLIAWNDVLIFSNRGQYSLKHCVSVFKIPPGKMTENLLQNIIPETHQPEAEEVLKSLRRIINLNDPILTFDTKPQKKGTCSFANLKSSLFPVLFFLELLQQSATPNDINAFNSEFLLSFMNNKPMLFKQLKEDTLTHYKKFTNYLRDTKIDELSNHFNTLAPNSLERTVYRKMIKAFIRDHHGQPLLFCSTNRNSNRIKKMSKETQRVEKILQTTKLLPDEKKSILTKALIAEVQDLESYFINKKSKRLNTLKARMAIHSLKWLVEKGADINVKLDEGETLLIKYAKKISTKKRLLKLLVELGADLRTTHHGKNAFQWAKLFQPCTNGPKVRFLESVTKELSNNSSNIESNGICP